jgi:hypothetical protein
MFPIPCAHKEPSQHLLEYVLESLQRQPLLLPLGDVLLGVLLSCLGIALSFLNEIFYIPHSRSSSVRLYI